MDTTSPDPSADTPAPETPPRPPSVGPGGNLDLDRIFTQHQASAAQGALYSVVNNMAHTLATVIAKVCPPSPERSLALTKVREAAFWANHSIAISPAPPVNAPTTTEEAEGALQVARQMAAEAHHQHATVVQDAEQRLADLRTQEEV